MEVTTQYIHKLSLYHYNYMSYNTPKNINLSYKVYKFSWHKFLQDISKQFQGTFVSGP